MNALFRVILVAFCLLALGLCLPSNAVGQQIGHKVQLATVYQPSPIILTISNEKREIRRILLHIQLESPTLGTGQLQLDATTCSAIDGFGETNECRPGIYAPEAVTFRRLRSYDPSGKKRWLFQIDGTQLQEELLLVVPTRYCHSYRLVVRGVGDGNVKNIVTLEESKPLGEATVAATPAEVSSVTHYGRINGDGTVDAPTSSGNFACRRVEEGVYELDYQGADLARAVIVVTPEQPFNDVPYWSANVYRERETNKVRVFTFAHENSRASSAFYMMAVIPPSK